MRKGIAALGLFLLIVAAFVFYIVFDGGSIAGFVVTGTSSLANSIAFLYVIIALPLGSGLAFFGLAFRLPKYASGGQPIVFREPSALSGAAIAVGVIALLVAFSAIGISFSGIGRSSSPAQVTTLSNQVSSLSSEVSSLNSELGAVNATPSVVAIKIQWCLQQVMQDRFCPGNIVVEQGDIVQVLFIQNDTADHTFTLDTPPYNFQINDSGAGQLDFLDNYLPVAGNCSNTGTYAEMSAGLSGVYCVSGTSLQSNATLTSHAAYIFRIAQNPNPGLPFTPGNLTVQGEPSGVTLTNPGPILIPVNDQAQMLALSIGPINSSLPDAGVNAGGFSESQGIGAFWATTPGVYEFFCKYHVSNGMFGYLIVLPNLYCNSNPSTCGLDSASSG
jgi:hypothetical protein